MCRREWTDGIPPLPLLTPPRSFPSFLLCFAACLLLTKARFPEATSLRCLFSLSIILFSLPLTRPTDPSVPLYFSFAGSVAVLSWARERCSVESSRNASDSTRLRLRALREFFFLRDEGIVCFDWCSFLCPPR